MKLLLFLLGCSLLACPSEAASDELMKDLTDFLQLLPTEEIEAIMNQYETNAEFVGILKYILESDEFKEIVLGLEAIPEYMILLRFFDESGLDVFSLLGIIHETLGLPPPNIPVPLKYQRDLTKGVINDICEEIREILPKEEIDKLHQEKLRTSDAFKYFVSKMTSTESMRLITDLVLNDDFTIAVQTLNDNGVDLLAMIDLSAEVFGF